MSTTLAYAAGIIDGEGCISVSRYYPKPLVRVDSCDRELVDWFVDNFGGHVSTTPQSLANVRKKDKYTWELKARAAIEFLIQIEPYLVIERRRQRARLAIEWPIEDGRSLNSDDRALLKIDREQARQELLAVK